MQKSHSLGSNNFSVIGSALSHGSELNDDSSVLSI